MQSTSSRAGRKVRALHVGISLISSSSLISSCLALGACKSVTLAGLACLFSYMACGARGL